MQVAVLLLFAASMMFSQSSFKEIAKPYDNESPPSAELKVHRSDTRQGVEIFDFSFVGPVSGRVPGTLTVPTANGKFPVILFGHWMMEGSPMRNRSEFLEEAIVLSKAGAICLLLDTPLVRTGVVLERDWTKGQEALAAVQMVREWRRALDLLLARPDVDPARVAYVGHSFSAGVGVRLAAIEKRIQSFVLMADPYAMRDYAYDERNPEMVAWRKAEGDGKIAAFFEKFPTEDGAMFAARSAPAALLLQNGKLDKSIPEHIVRKTVSYFQEPKRLEFYDAGHELNARARADRVSWLRQRLKLKPLDQRALDAIPPLR
jgi:cephalosporin-C deacetylase-like acetyl esterase